MGNVLLIVVDNPAHRVLFNRYLKQTPYHVVFATDGEDGYDRFHEVKPDMVIAHVNVARLDGTILCQLLRQEPEGELLPFILLGEELVGRAEIERRMHAVGADDVLAFPFSRQALLECLGKCFAHPRVPAASTDLLPSPSSLDRDATDILSEQAKREHLGLERGRTVQVRSERGASMPAEGRDAVVLERGRTVQVRSERGASMPAEGRDAVVLKAKEPQPELRPALRASPNIATSLHEFGAISTVADEVPQIGAPKEAPPDARAHGNGSGPVAVPRPPARSREVDADTVVSFQNPFYADPGTDPRAPSMELGPPGPPPVPKVAGAAIVSSALGVDEPPTPGGIRSPVGVATIDRELSTEEPLTHISRDDGQPGLIPPFPPPGAALFGFPFERMESAPPDVEDPDPLREQPLPARRDPLEEPKISASGVSRMDGSSGSAGSNLIHEPRLEQTPSASDDQRVSAVQKKAAGGRRGLDESQLGKRLSKRVRNVYRLLDQVDYYQLLGVQPDASDHELRTAYFDLSLEFHPDRFFLLRSGDLKEKIYVIFRRIGEAYRVLIDAEQRTEYDLTRKLSKRAPVDTAESAEVDETSPRHLNVAAQHAHAVRLVEQAKSAYAKGDLLGARLHLHLARAYEGPTDALEQALNEVVSHLGPTI